MNANQVTLAATSLGVLSQGDGTLATVTFEVLATKNSTLFLNDVKLADQQGNAFPVHVESAKVTTVTATEIPARIEIVSTPGPYISRDNIVEPKGGDFPVKSP